MKSRLKRWRGCLVLGLAVITFSPAPYWSPVLAADERPGTPDPLEHTLASYVRYGLANNPGIKAAIDAMEAQRKQVSLSSALMDPMVMGKVDLDEGGLSEVGVTQEVMFPSKLFLERRAARQLLGNRQALLNRDRANLVAQIRSSYADFYAVGRSLKAQRESLELLKQIEAVARAGYANAMESQGGLLKMQVELAMLEDEIRSMEVMADSERRKLASLLSLDPATPLPYPDSLPELHLPVSEAQVAEGLRANPQLAGMRSEEKAAYTMVTLAKHRFLPDFALSGQYMPSSSFMSAPGMDQGEGRWSVGVSLKVPLWIGRNLKEIGKARDMQREMTHRREAMQNELSAEAMMFANEVTDAQRRLTLFRGVLVPQARQVMELVQTQYRTAKASVLEFLDAQRTLLDLEVKQASESARREKAAARLAALMGDTGSETERIDHEGGSR